MRRRDRGRQIDCDNARQALSAGLDGEQAPVSASDLERHLAGCPLCRQFLTDARRLAQLAPPRPVRQAPAGLTAALTSALRHGAPVPPRARRVGRPSGARRRVRWVPALLPVLVVTGVFPFALASHAHIVPTRDRTPCTAALNRPHRHE